MIDKDFILGFLTFLLIILGLLKYQQQLFFYSSQTPVYIENNQIEKPKVYKLKVLGAVNKPGNVYITQWPPRVFEAIQAAGGLAEMADLTKIRPAESLIRAELLTIPFTFEEETRIIKKPEPIKKPKTIKKKQKKNNKKPKAKKKNKLQKLKANLQHKINVNIASIAELSMLPGIGETISARIIEYRAKSKFNKPEDLLAVKGIGKGKLEKLKPYIIF